MRTAAAATAAVVADLLAASVRLDRLRSKGDARDAATNVLEQIAVFTLADDMAEAGVPQGCVVGTQAHGVEQIAVAFYLKYILQFFFVTD